MESSLYNNLLDSKNIKEVVNELRKLFVRPFLGGKEPCKEELPSLLETLIQSALLLKGINKDSKVILSLFNDKIPSLIKSLSHDLEAIYNGDPAAKDKVEIILSYPGFLAIFVYRIAHELYLLDIPYLPRLMSEYAHSITGIDIHPGATIGEYFAIDHGTGIVIGETTIIGHHVRIYQGVTLGGISLERVDELRGKKRHPTIGNYVSIYAGATILGGDTIIGDYALIGSNTYILESIEKNTIVRLSHVAMEKIKRKAK